MVLVWYRITCHFHCINNKNTCGKFSWFIIIMTMFCSILCSFVQTHSKIRSMLFFFWHDQKYAFFYFPLLLNCKFHVHLILPPFSQKVKRHSHQTRLRFYARHHFTTLNAIPGALFLPQFLSHNIPVSVYSLDRYHIDQF